MTTQLVPMNHSHTLRWVKDLVSAGYKDIEEIMEIIVKDHPKIDWDNKSKNDLAKIVFNLINPKAKAEEDRGKSKEEIGNVEGEIAFQSDIQTIHPSIDVCRLGLLYGVWLPIETEESETGVVSVVSDVRWIGKEVGGAKYLKEHGVALKFDLPRGMERRLSLSAIEALYRKNTVMGGIYSPPSSSDPLVTTLTTLTSLINEKFAINKEELDICDIMGECYRHYIDFRNPKCYLLFPIWMIGTYMHVLFKSFPYISLFGFEASGKSKTMDISSLFAFNGQRSVGISPAAMYRGTQALRWTLFIDEAGLFKRGRSAAQRLVELMPLILEGYKKSSVVPRVGSKEKGYPLEYFEVYCPKMFADTTDLGWVLGSRTIQTIMRPTKRGAEIGNREMEDTDVLWEDVRDYLYMFAIQNHEEIKRIYDTIENEEQLKDREWELFKPLLSIARFFGEEKYKELLEFAKEQAETRRSEKARDRTEYLLIKAIMTIGKYDDWIEVKKITDELEEMVGKSDWMNSRWVGNTIKKFSLPCEKRRVSRGIDYKFKEDEIKEIIDRFGLEELFEDVVDKTTSPKEDEEHNLNEDYDPPAFEQALINSDKNYKEFVDKTEKNRQKKLNEKKEEYNHSTG